MTTVGNVSSSTAEATSAVRDEQSVSSSSTSDDTTSACQSNTSAASQSSADSAATSSEPTIVQTVALKTLARPDHGDATMREEDILQTSSTIEDETNSSSSSCRRYKNSPFGLKNHFITMPDAQQNAKFYQTNLTKSANKTSSRASRKQLRSMAQAESDGDEDEDEDGQVEAGHHQKAPLQHASSQETCDLSVLANSSVGGGSLSSPAPAPSPAPSPPWLYRPHPRRHRSFQQKQALVSQPNPREPIDLRVSDLDDADQREQDQKQLYARVLPAGDAGLDASQCNSKAGSDCYLAPISHPKTPGAGSKQTYNKHNLHDNNWDSSSLLVRFSSIMYATFLVILGCILHVSELRQKSKNSSDHIYTTIVALIGIIWLLFLQTDLQRYKKYASKYILIESIFNDHQRQARLNNLASGTDPSAHSTTSSSASLVNDRMSMNTEVIFKKTAYKMYQQRAAMDRQRHNYQAYKGYKSPMSSKLSSASGHLEPFEQHHVLKGSSLSSDEHGQHVQHHDNLIPAYKFLHGKIGANFYLKCGMAAFCFGHVIHEGLRFGQQLYFFSSSNVNCRDSAALIAHLVTPLYSFYQLFMMFKYSNLVINRHKVLARFGLMHIIGTSVTFWFRTILEEAFEDFVHKMDYFRAQNRPATESALAPGSTRQVASSNLVNLLAGSLRPDASDSAFVAGPQQPALGTNASLAQSALLALMSSPISATITPQLVRHLPDSYACAQNTLLTTKSMNALPYLYPFTIEYNLLLAATFLSLYFNVGKIGPPGACLTCGPIARGTGAHSKICTDSKEVPRKSRSTSTSFAGSHLELSDNSSAINRPAPGDHHHYDQATKDIGEYKSNFVVNADCHSANKGLFCGFFVLLVTLVTIVIFFVTINKPTHLQLGIKINLIQEATLTTLILVVTLAGFKQVVKLNRNPYLSNKVTTDDVLMLIPLPFFFIHSLLAFRAETATLYSGINQQTSATMMNKLNQLDSSPLASSNSLQSIILIESNLTSNSMTTNSSRFSSRSHLNNLLTGLPSGVTSGPNRIGLNRNSRQTNFSSAPSADAPSATLNKLSSSSSASASSAASQVDHFKLLTIVLNVAVMIEVLIQTNFIIDGLRRCSESRYLRFKKPGRELITFAIILNITYWIVATFETKSVEQYKTEIEYYGPLPYMFISHTTLPVMLFYRYHSSVCLAEIWNRAYKPPKRR